MEKRKKGEKKSNAEHSSGGSQQLDLRGERWLGGVFPLYTLRQVLSTSKERSFASCHLGAVKTSRNL